MFENIIRIIAVPIMILNMTAGIIGGIWLAIIGEWRLIGIGILILFTSHWLLSLLMMPGIAIGGLAILLYKKKNPLKHLFVYLSQLYTNILIAATCVLAFAICSSYYSSNSINDNVQYVPYLLWSWGMALGPWQYFASKEPNNEFTTIILFSASLLYLFVLVSTFIGPIVFIIAVSLFVLMQFIVLPIFNVFMANKINNMQDAF